MRYHPGNLSWKFAWKIIQETFRETISYRDLLVSTGAPGPRTTDSDVAAASSG